MMKCLNNRADHVTIAYIGGGSRGWAWTFMTDLALEPAMSGVIRLYDIDREAAKANEEALKAAKSRAEAVEEEARQKAKEIVEHANQSVEAEKERLANDVKTQVSVISVEIAKKVLSREITPEDDSALIDQCLKEWKGEHEND